MHKLLLLLSTILLLSACNSQNEPTAEEKPQLDNLKKIMYQTAKPLFEVVPDGLSEPKPQNGLPWLANKEKLNLTSVLADFNSNAEVEMKERFGKEYIQIKCNVPEGLEMSNSYLSASIAENKLRDKTGNSIKLKKDIQMGSGSGSSSRRVNGKVVIENANFVTFSAEIDKETNYQGPIKGELVVTVDYKDNFATTEISKSDVGQTVDFNGNKVKVIKVEGNYAVYDIEELAASEYSTMNTRDGVQLGLNFAKRDELKLGFASPASTATLDRQAYLIFEANPEISEKAFGDKIHNHLLKVLRDPDLQKDRITVSKQLGPIETLVLYKELAPQTGTLKGRM